MSYIGKEPTIGNFQVCDAISVVNNQAAYTMQVGSVNVSPQSAQHMLVSLNGILQAPTSSFTVSGSVITFASNLVTGDVIDFIQILGNVLDLGVPSDSTVSIAKLTATGTKDATTFLRGDNTFAAAGGDNTPAFEGYSTNGQAPADSTETKVELDGESFDTDSAFDTSTYRFTVPTGKGGKYYVYGNIAVDAQDDNDVVHAYIRIKKNGDTDLLDSYYNFSGNYPRDVAILVHGTVTLAAGDYIELYGYLNDADGSGRDFKGASGARLATLMGGYKLIGV